MKTKTQGLFLLFLFNLYSMKNKEPLAKDSMEISFHNLKYKILAP